MSEQSSSSRHNDASQPADAEAARRITELEFHLAHQQRVCEQLNEVVTDQARRLDRLERAVIRMEKQVKDLRDQPREAIQPADPLDERPPHY